LLIKCFNNGKCLNTNEETAHKRVINCTKIKELTNLGKLLRKLKCEWEKQVEKKMKHLDNVGKKVLQNMYFSMYSDIAEITVFIH
jgi:hypothetical protein